MAATDDIFLDMGFTWPVGTEFIAYYIEGDAGEEPRLLWMLGDYIYGPVNGVTASTAGTASATATRRQVREQISPVMYVGRTATDGALIEFSSTFTSPDVRFYRYVPSAGGGGGGGGGLDQAAVDARVRALVQDTAEASNTGAWGLAKGGTGEESAAAALTSLGGLTQAQVDARALARYTAAEKTKLSNVEASATADQTADQIATLLEGLTGADRVEAGSALRAVADAIDTELGVTTWRTGGGTGTGTPVATQDEGTEVEDETTTYNFVGTWCDRCNGFCWCRYGYCSWRWHSYSWWSCPQSCHQHG